MYMNSEFHSETELYLVNSCTLLTANHIRVTFSFDQSGVKHIFRLHSDFSFGYLRMFSHQGALKNNHIYPLYAGYCYNISINMHCEQPGVHSSRNTGLTSNTCHLASADWKPSCDIVPHVPLLEISTRPLPALLPPTRRSSE